MAKEPEERKADLAPSRGEVVENFNTNEIFKRVLATTDTNVNCMLSKVDFRTFPIPWEEFA